MKQSGKGVSQIIHTLINKGGMLVAGFVVGVITSRTLGPEGRGALALMLTVPMLCISIGEFGIRQSVAFLTGRDTFPRETITSSLMFFFYCTGTLSVILILFIEFQMGLDRYGLIPVIAVTCIAPVTLYQKYISGFLIADKRIETFNNIQLSTPLLLLATLAILAYYERLTLTTAAFSYLGSQVGSMAYIVGHTRLSPLPGFNHNVLKSMLKMGVLYAAGLFIQSLNYRADILILGSLRNDTSVGIYSVGVGLCEIIKMLPLAVGMVLFSRSVNIKDSDIKKLLTQTLLLTRGTLIITLAIALLLGISAKWLIPLLYGSAFTQSVPVLWILLPGVVSLSLFATLHLFVAGQGHPQIAIYAFLPALALNVVLNFFLIPQYDFLGSAVASTISYTSAVLIYLSLFMKKYDVTVSAIIPSPKDFDIIFKELKNKTRWK